MTEDIDILETLAEAVHKRWCESMRNAGWVYGKTKDLAAKTHPTMVDYSELSETEKDSDRYFVMGIPELLSTANLVVAERVDGLLFTVDFDALKGQKC